MAACVCEAGFAHAEGDVLSCVDIDECAVGNGGCDVLSTCTNAPGSFACGACPPAYSGTGSTGCVANPCSGVPDSSCPCLRVTPGGDDTTAIATHGLAPFGTVQAAIDFADAHRGVATNVCVAGGNSCSETFAYPGPASGLRMRNGINVYGSFETTGWTSCASITSTLEPLTTSGVGFGADVASATALSGVAITMPSLAGAIGVTVQGARGVALSRLAIRSQASPGNVTGVELSAGAESTLLDVTVALGGSGAVATGDLVGVRVSSSHLALSQSSLGVFAADSTGTGVLLENATGASIDATGFFLGASSEQGAVAAIRASGGDGLRVSGSRIEIDDSQGENQGISLVDAGEVSVTDTDIGVDGRNVFGVRAIGTRLLLDTIPSARGGAGEAYGVSLEDAPLSSVRGGSASGNTRAVGVRLLGDVAGVNLVSATSSGNGETSGILIEDCGGEAPVVTGSVTASASGSGANLAGIRARGDCNPRIEGASIALSGSDAGQLTGIDCGTLNGVDSACSIAGNSVAMNNARRRPGVTVATGIRCTNCSEISENQLAGLRRDGSSLDRAAYERTTGIASSGSATLIARNLVNAGCGYTVTGVSAAGRIENNDIRGGAGCGPSQALQGASLVFRSTGLEALGADVHSNSIHAGSAVDQATLPCESTGVSGSGSFRNNVIVKGICSPSAVSSSGLLQNNRIDGTVSVFGSELTAEQANDDPTLNASGNFSAGSLIDAGTPEGAPSDDFAGKPRNPAKPDVGHLEIADYCPEESCSGHGTCVEPVGQAPACECDSGYIHGATPLSCVIDGCYQNGGCDPLVTCTETDGGHVCGSCPSGYTGSGETGCTDIDECAAPNSVCDPLAGCTNTAGGFQCGACPEGYVGTGASGCVVDQCLVDNGGCDPLTTCSYLDGEFSCGACPPGTSGTGETGCTAEVCDPNPCENGGVCIGLPGGGHACDCPDDVLGANCENPLLKFANGDMYGCGLGSDGSLQCWGQVDVPEPRSESFVDFATTGMVMCGIRADGSLSCWGAESYGIGSPPSGAFQHVALSWGNACAIRSDRTIACWGTGDVGLNAPPSGEFSTIQLRGFACGLRIDKTLACWGDVAPNPPSGTFESLSLGLTHACAVRTDGTIACWGSGDDGATTPPSGTFTKIVSRYGASCALASGGTLHCWGSNEYGYAAPPSGTFEDLWSAETRACAAPAGGGPLACWGEANPSLPTEPPAVALRDVMLVSQGGCGRGSDGALVCWGQGLAGRPPGGAFRDTGGGCRLTYSGELECDNAMVLPVGSFTKLGTACAIRVDQSVACWGNNFYGEHNVPSGSFVDVSRDGTRVCAIRTDGTVACWGRPLAPPSGTFSRVAVGNAGACGIRTDGTLGCWAGSVSVPSGTFQSLSSGENDVCAVRTDGTIWCNLGFNSRLGEPPEGVFASVVVGVEHACALRADRTLACWGRDHQGSTAPPSGTFDAISANSFGACGIRSDRRVTCWGAPTR